MGGFAGKGTYISNIMSKWDIKFVNDKGKQKMVTVYFIEIPEMKALVIFGAPELDTWGLTNKYELRFTNLNFTVPHKNLIYRNFVLYPLREILPLWKHPVSRIPVNALIGKLSSNDKKSILKVKKY